MPADTGGLPSIQPAHLVCANKACKKAKNGNASTAKAVMACGRCKLVAYCCIKCKEKNAEKHKKDCESDLLKADWKPVWIRQHRMPTFLSDEGPKMEYFGTFKYLWGNIPAVDIVKLRENEGVRFERNLDLLLPASGDLRNVIMSIGKLPQEYKHDVSVVLNDKEFDVVARNVILLLIFATIQNADTAADCVLHVFYSAFITKSHMDILTIMLRPLVQDVCTKTEGKDQEALLAKTWTLKDGVQMRVVLSRRQWLRLLAMTEAPKKIKIGKAKATRDKVVNARAREDYRDRHMLCQIPHMRMGSNKFYADGMLLPFGTPRADFTMPNPTFFQEKDVWPMMDSSDPLSGWSLPDVLDSQRGPARKDARQWLRLLAMTEAPKKIKIGKAKATRDKVVNARAREDYRDRHMLCQIPHMRMGSNKFYADGMLLPFGTPRADFTMPNPTFFQEKDVWPMMDSSDPLAGWSLPDVLDSQRGPARKDAYGALYEYIFNRGREFHGQLAFRKISFELCCTDVRLLKDMIPNKKFDRIEASNICDTGYLGIESTLDADVWPMMDSSDPLSGWSLPDVLDSQRGPARKDAYGALYEYIFNRGREFHGQLAFRKISFELCCTDVRLLKDMIPNKKFDRIEASNICDTGYLGIESTLDAVSPMLKTPEVNDKATILMVFLNAVEEVVISLGPTSDDEKVFEKVMEYMDKPAQFSSLAPLTSMMAAVSLRDEALNFTIRSMAAKDTARDIDMIFDAYMKRFRFDDVGVTRGVQMKEKNTIVEKWPMRFYFNGPTAKAKKEFAWLLSSHHIGHERYVEWKAMRKFVIEESL
ncbi:hypothetical protein GGTG_13307 [Gaeumannomyces tritici R3-111a-1]|uniref:DUF4470 domain-containing protein n=1 Tax=Gaeumannomyces tritici (strain R3-111a-1) TaxID=644352 RepID=J3PIH9_GAET3|nr:hypothetical protein GGTG_13307 [Gaeumannomyces tritici R3-111a-1]EJT69198.1 hypothetical protein GGTG_13307 [Gaeumannomyces tritici R3-111a-1]